MEIGPLTIGGLPASEAWTWSNPDTCQLFGRIVYKLMSGRGELRRQGYRDYHEFRRYFMAEEFDSMLDRLEAHRDELGHRRIASMLAEIREQIQALGHACEAEPHPFDESKLPSFLNQALRERSAPVQSVEAVSVRKPAPIKIEAQQLSLF